MLYGGTCLSGPIIAIGAGALSASRRFPDYLFGLDLPAFQSHSAAIISIRIGYKVCQKHMFRDSRY